MPYHVPQTLVCLEITGGLALPQTACFPPLRFLIQQMRLAENPVSKEFLGEAVTGKPLLHRNVTGEGEERQLEARRTAGGTQRSCPLHCQDQTQGQRWLDFRDN